MTAEAVEGASRQGLAVAPHQHQGVGIELPSQLAPGGA